jgi:hypothetical protein
MSKISLVCEALFIRHLYSADWRLCFRRLFLPSEFHFEHLQQLRATLLELFVLKIHAIGIPVGASPRFTTDKPWAHLLVFVVDAVEFIA